MATTAIWSVKGDLGRVVNYAANPDKTTFSQADIDALTQQRTELYHQKRKDPENKMLLSEIQSINQSIRGRRKELRICARIEADIPIVRQKVHELIPLPPKREKPTTKRKTRQLQR